MTNLKYFLLLITIAIPMTSFSEVIELKPAEKYCRKVTGISQGAAESLANRLKVSNRSIEFIRASSMQSPHGCLINLDTPKGPENLACPKVYSDGSSVWSGGYCY